MKMLCLFCFVVLMLFASCGGESPEAEYSGAILDIHVYEETDEETRENILELNEETTNMNQNEQSDGLTSPPPTLESLPEPFEPIFTHEPIPLEIAEFINGVSFHENTHFGMDFLAYVTVTHKNFHGESVIGHVIVAAEIADEVLDIFRDIYAAGFPIHSIRLIDYFSASDYDSMAANNSSAFNFRYIDGTQTLSRHAFGMAIDINPAQNPYIRDDVIWPEVSRAYLDRDNVRPGMIVRGDAVYTAFRSRGWIWGGDWRRPIDYHHFERR